MVLKGMALIFAIILILMGVLGFIPSIALNHSFFGLFEMSFLRNLFYILTGLIALSASGSASYAKLFFQFFGCLYALIAILGFAMNGSLWVVHVSIVDSFFHLIIAMISLYVGFTSKIPSSLYSH